MYQISVIIAYLHAASAFEKLNGKSEINTDHCTAWHLARSYFAFINVVYSAAEMIKIKFSSRTSSRE